MVLPANMEEYKNSSISQERSVLSRDITKTPKRFAFSSMKNNIKIVDIESGREQIAFQGPKLSTGGEIIEQ